MGFHLCRAPFFFYPTAIWALKRVQNILYLENDPEAYEEVSAENWLKLKNLLAAYHMKRVAFYEFTSTHYGNDKLAVVKSQLESSGRENGEIGESVTYIPMTWQDNMYGKHIEEESSY